MNNIKKKRKYVKITRIFIAAILLTLLAVTLLLPINAEGNTKVIGAIAPGGSVTTVDDLIAALGGTENVQLSSDGITVSIKKDILLNAPVVFFSGSYKIVGRGCTIYKGFSQGAMFHLSASSLTNEKGEPLHCPTLTLGEEISIEAQNLDEPNLILDGNSEGFTDAVNGPIIALIGQTNVTINPSTKLTNNSSFSPGGAIYLESLELGTEVSPLSPTLYINGGEISGNSSLTEGGAIAAYGRLSGANSGEIQINSCKIEGNTVVPEDKFTLGRGGAIFSNGMRLLLSNCEITSNSADEGGAIYANYETVISNCSITKNRAEKNGGAIYSDLFMNEHEQSSPDSITTLISAFITENHSNGAGGAIFNKGEFTLSAGHSSYISQNTAMGNGAVIVNEGEMNLESGEFFYNSTSNGFGGIYNTGTLNYKGADTRINTAKVGGAIYNIGTLNFTSGCISKNNCTVKNAPQIANLGKMNISGSFIIDEDVIGLFPIPNESNRSIYTDIRLTNKITTNVKINVSIYKNIPDASSDKDMKYANKNGLRIFSGIESFTETAALRSQIVDNGIGSYKISPDGILVYVFPLMPLGAWIACIAGITVITCGAVFFIKKRKHSSLNQENEEKESAE